MMTGSKQVQKERNRDDSVSLLQVITLIIPGKQSENRHRGGLSYISLAQTPCDPFIGTIDMFCDISPLHYRCKGQGCKAAVRKWAGRGWGYPGALINSGCLSPSQHALISTPTRWWYTSHTIGVRQRLTWRVNHNSIARNL